MSNNPGVYSGGDVSAGRRNFLGDRHQALLVAVTAGIVLGQAASASVVALTNGGPAGGLSLDAANVVAAQDAVSSAEATASSPNTVPTEVVQGVTFNSSQGGVNVSITYDPAPGDSGIFTPETPDQFSTSDPNNAPLLAIDNAGLLYNSHSKPAPQITATITGLTPGGTYTIDSLASVLGYGNYQGGAGRSEIVSAGPTALTPTATDQADIFNGNLYDIHQTGVVATGGTIVVTYSGTANPAYQNGGTGQYSNDEWPNDGAVLTAVIVTQVPEPASLGLLTLGGLGLLARRRRA